MMKKHAMYCFFISCL